MNTPIEKIQIVDSHTGGEPTRLIVGGGPDLGSGSMAERQAVFRDQHDRIRSAAVNEPRGSEVIVGGILCEPVDPAAATGVIYFNNVGYLGMCGHGTIGLGVTLAYLGRIEPGVHLIETSVGDVSFELIDRNTVEISNVASYRYAKDVPVDVPGVGTLVGDIAWGGNWFYLVRESPVALELSNARALTDATVRTMEALREQGITGADQGEIDHIEFFGPPVTAGAMSRSFVLCPGGAFDRSPCGTGTSAKLACLAADGKLAPNEKWVQESIIGSTFEGWYTPGEGDTILPRIRGQAFVTSEATLLLDPNDPFRDGF